MDLQEITIKLDQKTVNFLMDEVRKKRTAGAATSFSDKFLIRLVEALNNRSQAQVFRIKDGNPIIRDYSTNK